jgi:hypothetical protein
MARPPQGKVAMTNAERQRRFRNLRSYDNQLLKWLVKKSKECDSSIEATPYVEFASIVSERIKNVSPRVYNCKLLS